MFDPFNSNPMGREKIHWLARRRARNFALQAIYQWQLTHDSVDHIATQFLAQEEVHPVDTEFFKQLLWSVVAQFEQLDAQIHPLLDRPASALNEVERAIFRIGAYELNHCLETPYKVILNEAIELAKTFAFGEAHKYVNGVLHQLARLSRPQEL